MDPYSANPLAELAAEASPSRYNEVAAVKDAPKLFAGGTADVPAFTASGIDPQHLLKLPYGVRHAAAANPDITEVHRWFEEYAEFPETVIPHDGLTAAHARVNDWLENTDIDPRTPEQRAADEDAEFRAFAEMALPDVHRELTKESRAEVWEKKQALAAQIKELG